MDLTLASNSAELWISLLSDVASAGIGAFACLELACPASLPQLLKDALEFGKVRARDRGWTLVRWLEVPKRWFWHFYLSGLLSAALLLCARHWRFDSAGPLAGLNYFTNQLLAIPDLSMAPWLNYLPIALQTCQMLRRMLECLLVSVYSPGTMNLVHYGLGCSFYFCVVYALMLRLPEYSISLLRAIVFTVAHVILAYNQFRVARILAALRKNPLGHVVHHRHGIAKGHLFQYVSSPHYSLEILIYVNLFALTGCSTSGLLFHLLVFVIVNQSASALITHAWYRREFGAKYPTCRKALVPWLL